MNSKLPLLALLWTLFLTTPGHTAQQPDAEFEQQLTAAADKLQPSALMEMLRENPDQFRKSRICLALAELYHNKSQRSADETKLCVDYFSRALRCVEFPCLDLLHAKIQLGCLYYQSRLDAEGGITTRGD